MAKEKDEKKALIPQDEKTLQEMLKPAPGTEEISSEDIILPRIRVLQDNSAEVKSKEAQSGKLKHSLTGELNDTLEFIPIAMHKSRIMFNIDNREGAPLCRSNNFEIGSDGTKCTDCDNNKWQNNKPPVCNTIFNYWMIQPKEVGNVFVPSILSLMKTSSQAALKLNTSVQCAFPKLPFWSKVWKVIPRIKRFPKGDAYILDVQQIRETNKDERDWAALIYKNIVNKKVEYTADEIPTDDIIGDDLHA